MDNETILNLFINKSGLDADLLIKKPIRGLPGFSLEQLIKALLINTSVLSASKYLGYSDNPIKQAIREYLLPIFPERKSTKFISSGGKSSWRYAIIEYIGYKECSKCDSILKLSEYSKNNTTNSGLAHYCKKCCLVESKKHKYYISERTPGWADLELISDFYRNCPKNYEVDHIVPLRGKNVSGLHVLNNLQYLPINSNRIKSNKYET